MSQMDLLDLLVEAEQMPAVGPPPANIAAEVTALWLDPHTMNRVIQAPGTPRMEDVRRWVGDAAHSRRGPGYHVQGTGTGVHVLEWFGAEPFRLSLNRMFAVVRAHADVDLAKQLASVCDGRCGGVTAEQWAAADAILPRRAS